MEEKFYVYILSSLSTPDKMYVGYTNDLKNRLKEHNAGECKYSKEHMPWKLRTCLYFDDKKRAEAFEKYLKSGSGRAFSTKRL